MPDPQSKGWVQMHKGISWDIEEKNPKMNAQGEAKTSWDKSLTQAKGQGGASIHFCGAESAAAQGSFLGVSTQRQPYWCFWVEKRRLFPEGENTGEYKAEGLNLWLHEGQKGTFLSQFHQILKHKEWPQLMRLGLKENSPLSRELRVPQGQVPEPRGPCRVEAGSLMYIPKDHFYSQKNFKQKDLYLTKHCFSPWFSPSRTAVPARAMTVHASHFPPRKCVFLSEFHNWNIRIYHLPPNPTNKPGSISSLQGSLQLCLRTRKIILKGKSKPEDVDLKPNRPGDDQNPLHLIKSTTQTSCKAWPTGHFNTEAQQLINYISKRHVGGLLCSVYPKRASLGNIKSFESN